MDRIFKRLDTAFRIPSVAVGLTLLSVASGVTGVLGFFQVGPAALLPLAPLFTVAFMVLIGVAVLLAVSRVYGENQALRRCFEQFHYVTHFYRDSINDFEKATLATAKERRRAERDVLNTVCPMISKIFWHLTKRECHVCVTLLRQKKDDHSPHTCFLWARSSYDPRRPEHNPVEFVISKEKNTRFYDATQTKPSGLTFFHCGDLLVLKEKGGYVDQLENWEKLYRSCIIVPIRRVLQGQVELLGFLKVETMFPNRLNDSDHVHVAAAFADQMFNFLMASRASEDLQVPQQPVLSPPAPRVEQKVVS